jgi:hypothetical protein
MGWKDISYKDRWIVFTATLQAFAAVGMFIVALIGIWKVTPIITYEIEKAERQEAEEKLSADIVSNHSVTSRYVQDALTWWTEQVNSYERILELLDKRTKRGWKVSFQIREAGGNAVAPQMTPDLLVVSASGPGGEKEVVSVPVNDKAMGPSQYLQCKANQGAFAELPHEQRLKLESVVSGYLNRYMLPRVLPAFVRADMSLEKLHDEIALQQERRKAAMAQIRGLKDVLDAELRGN